MASEGVVRAIYRSTAVLTVVLSLLFFQLHEYFSLQSHSYDAEVVATLFPFVALASLLYLLVSVLRELNEGSTGPDGTDTAP